MSLGRLGGGRRKGVVCVTGKTRKGKKEGCSLCHWED